MGKGAWGKRAVVFLAVLVLISKGGASSPYQSFSSADGAVFLTAAIVGGTAFLLDRHLDPFTREELARLNVQAINPFDRPATGYHSETSQRLSDWGMRTALLLPAFFVFDSDAARDGKKIAAMYAETCIAVSSLTEITKVTVKRTRPYVYSTDPSRAEQLPRDARKSFFSGHTSTAFAAAVFAAKVFEDYHPDSRLRSLVWGGSLTLASAVGIWRVTAGKHFPSDVLAAAVIGSTIGYAVPYFHKKTSAQVSLSPSPQLISFTLFF